MQDHGAPDPEATVAAVRPAVALRLQCAPVSGSAPRARAALRDSLTGTVFADRLDDAELALSELVTNAVLHARGSFTVTIEQEASALRVSVQDACAVSPSFSMLDRTAVTGRGLMLVSAVADRWGVDPIPGGGKRVWFEMTASGSGQRDVSDVDALLQAWSDDLETDPARELVRVVLTDLDTDVVARSEAHVQALLRELALVGGAAAAEHRDSDLTVHRVLEAAARTDSLRAELRHQVSLALTHAQPRVDVTLSLRREAASCVLDLARALEEADRLARAGALLSGVLLLEPVPAGLTQARTAYLRRIAAQLSF